MNRGLRLGGEVLDVHVVVIEVDGDAIEHIVIDLICQRVHARLLEAFEGGVLGDVLLMVVHVLRKALVLGHLGHLDEVALAALQQALGIRLLKPLVVVGKPLEQVMGVDVNLRVGDFAESVTDVAGVIRDLVAVLAEVEV